MSGPPSPHIWTPPFTPVWCFLRGLPSTLLLMKRGSLSQRDLSGLRASVNPSALSPKYQTQYTIVFTE